MDETQAALAVQGYAVVRDCPDTRRWAKAAAAVAEDIIKDPAQRAAWLRCGDTWFAGVNVFPNQGDGSVPDRGVPALGGAALRLIAAANAAHAAVNAAHAALDAAQISVCWPGYPKLWEGRESEAAARYRRNRDAAHVDGLRPVGPDRRRHISETHSYILGLPLSDSAPGASPFVVWEGSHEIIRAALAEALADVPPQNWPRVDVTDAYHAARRRCFEVCPRVEIHGAPGDAWLVHRLALHGVAPWIAAAAPPRMVAYFRPDGFNGAAADWLTKP